MTLAVVLAAACAGLAVLAAALAVALRSSRRAARRSEDRVAEAVAELSLRMDRMGRDLADALRRAEDEAARAGRLADLAATIDLPEVLERVLEAAVSAAVADAALVWLPARGDAPPTVTTLGLSEEEARRERVASGPPDGRAARSVALAYRYADEVEQTAGGGALVRAGLVVPVHVGSDQGDEGSLAVFTRSEGEAFGEDAERMLVEVAERAAPAIRNALHYREARRLAELDALTGLHNRRYFHDALDREVARAQRYGRKLALVVLDVDDFKDVNDRVGHLAGDAVLAELSKRVLEVVRGADAACRVGGDELAILLPESTLEEAELLYRRIQSAVSSRPIGEAGTLRVSAGVAELQEGDDGHALFQRADAALYEAKGNGKARIAVAAPPVSESRRPPGRAGSPRA